MVEQQNVQSQYRSDRIFAVDSFASGISFGQHKIPAGVDPRDYYSLRLEEEAMPGGVRSRYILDRKNPLHELEKRLEQLACRGILGTSIIHFGTMCDPFSPFSGKFDASMRFLELFNRFVPGQLVVQTRSPLIVIALPVLKKLGSKAAVTLGIETPSQQAADRYTPGLPQVGERLRAANVLRRFNVEVTLQVGPVLPYGDFRRSAGEFAKVLSAHSDYIHLMPMTDGSAAREKQIRSSVIAKKLAADGEFSLLGPGATQPLKTALDEIAPRKMQLPLREHLKPRQMSIFAA
jgi:hypothetical protein